MTPAELDRWLAEHVMGWRITANRYSEALRFWGDADGRHCHELDPFDDTCPECDWWHPATNIAQAIEAAEKALADCRISAWFVGRHVGGMPHVCVDRESGERCEEPISELPEALCRALHAALAPLAPLPGWPHRRDRALPRRGPPLPRTHAPAPRWRAPQAPARSPVRLLARLGRLGR